MIGNCCSGPGDRVPPYFVAPLGLSVKDESRSPKFAKNIGGGEPRQPSHLDNAHRDTQVDIGTDNCFENRRKFITVFSV